jgi:hypothetical protein
LAAASRVPDLANPPDPVLTAIDLTRYTELMWHELWDTESRNLLYSFESELEALEAARELIALNPGSYPGALALSAVDTDGRMTTLALGEALAARLRLAEAERGRLPA